METIPHHRTQNVLIPITHQLSAPNVHEITIFDDAIRSVDGLIAIFIENINHIHCHSAAIQAFRSLIKVLAFVQKLHHLHSSMGEDSSYSSSYNRTLSLMKRKIFHTILSLRTNRWAQLGVVNNHITTHESSTDECVRFSPYILIREVLITSTQSSPPVSPQRQQQQQQQQQSVLETNSNSPIMNTSSTSSSSSSSSFHGAFIEALKLVIDSIQCEKDWSVLHLIFVELPKTLKHKGLILAATSSTNSSNHSTPSSSMTHLCIKNESIPDLMVNALCKFVSLIFWYKNSVGNSNLRI